MKDAGATRFVDRHLCLGFMIDCIAHPEKNEKIGGVQGFYDGGRFTGGKEKEQRPEQPRVSIPLQVMSLWRVTPQLELMMLLEELAQRQLQLAVI